ncbi:class I SAM-dependent methyltransferase [Herminiimonas glaciei]|uniref:Class I SAM-dependent methyltransferase n=1 Tax=Herminiimonas glaciei TaxID=523788 RepID=A0ABW2I7M1_9BURK
MNTPNCPTCSKTNFITLTTYKRYWHCCRDCGTAISEQRDSYPLAMLPYADLKKGASLDEEKMYDYFVEDIHINWSEREGQEFIDDYLRPANFEVGGKRLLDISGGNGHFIKQIEKLGAQITLTEINKKTIDYARQKHGFEVFEYNLNEHDLPAVTNQRFDIVFARACLMFAKDLSGFAAQIRRSLTPGGYVMINHSVIPTLGVMLRTQLDEFSYFILRQPESIIEEFLKHGFALHHRSDETDPGLYVYDNDLLPHWRMVHRIYEKKGVRALQNNREFSWPARDRRRSTLVFKLVD